MTQLADKIDRLVKLRDEYRAANKTYKTLNDEFKELEAEVIELLKTEKSESFKSRLGTATPGSQEYVMVDDWDTLWDWLFEKKANYMLKRQLANAAVLEYRQMTGELPPGCRVGEKPTLSLRKR